MMTARNDDRKDDVESDLLGRTYDRQTRNDKVEGRDMPRPCCFSVHWPKSLNTFSE